MGLALADLLGAGRMRAERLRRRGSDEAISLALAAGLMLAAGAAVARSGPTSSSACSSSRRSSTRPPGAAAAIDEVVYANVFEGLTRFAPDGSVLPALAESWEIAPDGLSWVFTPARRA